MVREFIEKKGIEYVREKIAVVDSEPRKNAARTFLAALKGDWKLPVKRYLRPNRSLNRRPKNRYRRSAMENGRSKERRPWQRSMSYKNQCAAGRKRMQ
jgi:hypothetical protein